MDRPILIDTDVLIDFRRGSEDGSTFCAPLVSRGLARVHPVTIFELLDGVMDRAEIAATQRVISALGRVPVRDADFIAARGLLESLQRSHGVGWPDCLIAATALRLRLPVATLNRKHFGAFPRLSVIAPY